MKNRLIIVSSFLVFAVQAQNQTDLLIDAFGNYEKRAYPEAILAFDQLIGSTQSPGADWFLYKGIAEFRMGRYEPAEVDFRKASSGNNSEADLWNARIQVISGHTKEALMIIENYLKEADYPDVQSVKKDSLFLSLHNTPEWFALWQNDWQTEEQKIQEDAEYYIKKKDFEQAHLIIGNGLGKGLNESTLHYLNSKVYEAEGNLQLALNEINSALSPEPTNQEFLKRKARILIKLSMYSDAVNTLTAILSHFPEDFEARFSRTTAALMAGNIELAKNDLAIYMKYFNSDDALFLASRVYYKAGNYFDALRNINPLLEKDQSNASYFKLRGMIYYETLTFKQSAYDLSMSLDLTPDDAEANYFLGLAEFKLGHNKPACYYMQRAKKYGELKAVSFLQEHCEK